MEEHPGHDRWLQLLFSRLDAFVQDLAAARGEAELAGLLGGLAEDMGFAYFALAHHVDIPTAPQPAIRVHNYPEGWQEYFDDKRLGRVDPVHRASHRTSVGFAWSRLTDLIELTGKDREVLQEASRRGIGDGFTIPAHVPGEANGSCSFATRRGEPLDPDNFPLAQLAGAFAFEAARRIWQVRGGLVPRRKALTQRQRDCLLWAARGKTDWEIARILGVRHDTVIEHLRHARERYCVQKRTSLAIAALFDGTLSFAEVMGR